MSFPQVTTRPERVQAALRAATYFAKVTASVANTLRDLEGAIDLLDARLDQLQPPHTGRVRVQWESRGLVRGYEAEKTPCVVEWSRNKARGTWRSKRVPLQSLMLRAKSSGEFEGNAHLVRQVLADLQVLLAMHKATRARIAKLDGDWARALPQVTRRLEGVLKRAERLQPARHG